MNNTEIKNFFLDLLNEGHDFDDLLELLEEADDCTDANLYEDELSESRESLVLEIIDYLEEAAGKEFPEKTYCKLFVDIDTKIINSGLFQRLKERK